MEKKSTDKKSMDKNSKIRIVIMVILSIAILASVITLVAVFATKCSADKGDVDNVGEEPGGNGGTTTPDDGSGEQKPDDEPNKPAEHKHEYGEWVIVTQPTEETEGEATRTCDGCEEGTEGHSESVTLPKLSAEGEEYSKTEDTATCTEGGIVTYTLEEYGISFDVPTPAKGHTMTFNEKKPATCVEAGIKEYYKCSVCGRYYQDKDGESEYSDPSEMIIGIDKENGHQWNDGEITTAATCTTPGEKTYTCQHDGTHTKTESYEDPTAHKLGELISEKPATCTKTGTIAHYKCSECNKCFEDEGGKTEISESEMTIAIDETAHQWDDGEITTAATCQAAGGKTYTCLHDGTHTKTEEIPIDPDAHQWGTDNVCTLCQTDMDYTKDGLDYQKTADQSGYEVKVLNLELTEVIIPAYYGEGDERLPVTTIRSWGVPSTSKVVSITIPDTVTTIKESAFLSCTNLTTVIFGKNSQLTTIGKSAFQGCTALVNMTIPDTVTTTIGDDAFYGCANFTSVIIGNGVTTIGKSAFQGCGQLTTVIFGEKSRLKTIGESCFEEDAALISINIPDSVTSMGDYGLQDCKSLKTVNFGKNSRLKSIGSYCFSGCEALISITIPSSVTSIGAYAFESLSNLTTVNIEGTALTEIGDYAFSWTGLTEINIPGIWKIGESAFYGCKNLAKVKFREDSEEVDDSSPITIGASAFYDCDGLTEIFMPAFDVSIDEQAFLNCGNLESVLIYYANHVGKGAFGGCGKLRSVQLTKPGLGASIWDYDPDSDDSQNRLNFDSWYIYKQDDKSDSREIVILDPETLAYYLPRRGRDYVLERSTWWI